jgi:hypothetical protein
VELVCCTPDTATHGSEAAREVEAVDDRRRRDAVHRYAQPFTWLALRRID